MVRAAMLSRRFPRAPDHPPGSSANPSSVGHTSDVAVAGGRVLADAMQWAAPPAWLAGLVAAAYTPCPAAGPEPGSVLLQRPRHDRVARPCSSACPMMTPSLRELARGERGCPAVPGEPGTHDGHKTEPVSRYPKQPEIMPTQLDIEALRSTSPGVLVGITGGSA